MGEYAMLGRERIKIGTCEDMYYLRADQSHRITPEPHSLDPRRADMQAVIRFRFPWPDEDGVEPGAFDPCDRAVAIHGVTVPEGVEHHAVQFSAHSGYLLSPPCPESPKGQTWATHADVRIARNGFAGPVKIVQQAYRGGHLALIAQCGGCGARYNLPTREDAEPYVVACRAEADRRLGGVNDPPDTSRARWWHTIADRISAGYGQPEMATA